MLITYAVAIFFLVTLSCFLILFWLFPDRSQRRLQALRQNEEKTDWVKTVADIASPLAKLSIPEGNWENSPLRTKLMRAGIRNSHAPVIFYACKTLLPFVFAAIAYAALKLANMALERNTLIFVLLISATIGCYLPNVLLNRKIAERKREIFNNFPDAADLMLVCVEAGLGLDAAMVKVSEELRTKSSALAQELHLTNLETRAGNTREQALRNLALRSGLDEINAFVSMLSQADKFGTSVGDSLRVFSEDLRHKRQIRAEELAAKLPTKMLFPLVLCIFPAISMVILGPAGIRIFRQVLPLIGGQS